MSSPTKEEQETRILELEKTLLTENCLHLKCAGRLQASTLIIRELMILNEDLRNEGDILIKVRDSLQKTISHPVQICPSCGNVTKSKSSSYILCTRCYLTLEEKPIFQIKIPERPCDKVGSSEVEDV